MEKTETFRSHLGTFKQVKNDGDPLTIQNFLKEIDEDFFARGWGYDPLMHGVFVPIVRRHAYIGDFIMVAIDRDKNAEDYFMVNSFDLSVMFKK